MSDVYIIGFVHTYGTCYFRRHPLCVHYSYCSPYSLIIIYSSSSQFIISKVMNQRLYALSFNNLILGLSEPHSNRKQADHPTLFLDIELLIAETISTVLHRTMTYLELHYIVLKCLSNLVIFPS
jgi:hypothetical protein